MVKRMEFCKQVQEEFAPITPLLRGDGGSTLGRCGYGARQFIPLARAHGEDRIGTIVARHLRTNAQAGELARVGENDFFQRDGAFLRQLRHRYRDEKFLRNLSIRTHLCARFNCKSSCPLPADEEIRC